LGKFGNFTPNFTTFATKRLHFRHKSTSRHKYFFVSDNGYTLALENMGILFFLIGITDVVLK